MIAPAQVLGLLALLAAALLIPLGVIGLRERATQRGATFAALMFCLAGWTLGVGLELLTLRTNLIFDVLTVAGMAAGPVLWLQFNLAYTEQSHWLTRWRLALLWSFAAIFAVLALTNSLHHWVVQAAPPVVGVAIFQRIPAGPGQLYGVYTLALSVTGLVALLRYARRSARLRRAQAIILCAAAVIPLLAGALHVSRVGPLAAVPLTAQSFLLSALMLWFAVIRFHLMSVPPRVHRILFENMSDAALVLDRWDNLVEANPAAMALFGIDDDDLAKPFASVMPWPELLGIELLPRQEIVRAGAAGSDWYEVRTARLPATRGARAGKVLLLRNISEARRSRQQLEESETLYRNVVERQGEGIAILDDDSVFVYANPAAATILGTTPGALAGRSLFEFFTAAQLQAYRQEQEQRAVGATATFELAVTRRDGAERMLLMTVAPNRPDVRQGLLVMFRDITDAQTAERLSQQWRQRYERIAAVSGQLVYYHDAATNAVEWGESVQQVFGYTRAELDGGIVQWANLLHPADRQRVLAALATAEDAYEDHYRLQHKLGHYLLIHTHILPVHTAAGALLGYVGVVRDVSRQHQLQQAVFTHARRLEQLQELSLALSSQHSPDSLRDTIVQGAVRVLDASAAVLYVVEPVRGAVRRVASEPPYMTDVLNLQPASTLALQVIQTQQMQQTSRAVFDTPLATPALTQLAPAVRIGAPLYTNGVLGAVLIVEDSKRTAPFTAEDEQLLRLIANQAAAELAKGHLLADTTMRAQRLLLVNEITTAVIQVIDLPVVLQHIVSGLARVLGADEAAIALFDEGRQQLAILAHHAPDAASLRTAPDDVIGEQLLRLVLQTRRPVYVADALADGRTEDMRSQLARRNIAAVLVFPVVAGEEVLGVLVANFTGKQPAGQREDDLRIGETLANLAAVRIQQVRLYNTLQRLSIVDELTQVYNFRALFEIGENEFARACQQQRPLAAIFIDIDHFGEFNTRYSHTVGNQVLRAVGRRLLAITRQVDLVARFGGEEFVVLLPETDAPLATTIGYRIHQEISKLQVATDHGQLGVTVSVGVAPRTPEMRTLQDLINRANAGEHRAKAEGRNRVVVC